MPTAHISQLDPDFRRQPKTDHFCCICQRDIKGAAAGSLHFVCGGMQEITDSQDFNAAGDMGCFPVGPECARKVRRILGPGFLHQLCEEVA